MTFKKQTISKRLLFLVLPSKENLKVTNYQFYKAVVATFLLAIIISLYSPAFVQLFFETIIGIGGISIIISGSKRIKSDYPTGIRKIILGSSLLTGSAIISGVVRYFVMDLHIFLSSNFAFLRKENNWQSYEKYEWITPIITGGCALLGLYVFGFIHYPYEWITILGIYLLSIAYSINNIDNFQFRRILGVLGGVFIVLGGGLDIYFNWGNWFLIIICGAFVLLNIYFVYVEAVNYFKRS